MAFNINDVKNLSGIQNMTDIKAVWDNLDQKNWQGLFNAIRKVREEKGNNQTLDKLEDTGRQASDQGADFPTNPAGLAALVNKQS